MLLCKKSRWNFIAHVSARFHIWEEECMSRVNCVSFVNCWENSKCIDVYKINIFILIHLLSLLAVVYARFTYPYLYKSKETWAYCVLTLQVTTHPIYFCPLSHTTEKVKAFFSLSPYASSLFTDVAWTVLHPKSMPWRRMLTVIAPLSNMMPLCTELSPVSLSWTSFSREEMLGFHVEDNSVSLALLGLMVALLLRLSCNLLHLCHHLHRENNGETSALSLSQRRAQKALLSLHAETSWPLAPFVKKYLSCHHFQKMTMLTMSTFCHYLSQLTPKCLVRKRMASAVSVNLPPPLCPPHCL